MIEFLKIENLALMHQAQIEFNSGFTAVTGETGAGKSVLLGALSLLAGNKCGKEIIRNQADFCKVEALLNFEDISKINEFLESNGIPIGEDNTLLLSRILNRKKSSRIFINGALAPLNILSDLGNLWIDFHGPHESQKLFSAKNQLSMIDNFSNHNNILQSYLSLYKERENILKNIENLKNSKKLTADEIDFLKNQIADIEELNPSEESIEQLENSSKLAEMASDIVEKSNAIYELIEGEEGAINAIIQANKLAADLQDAGDDAMSLYKRLTEISVEISDIASEYERLAQSCDMSEEQIQQIRQEMSAWFTLTRKYGASVELVLNAKAEMINKIETQSDVKATIAKLENQQLEIENNLKPIAEKIYQNRCDSSKELSQNAQIILSRLGFKNAKLNIDVKKLDKPSIDCGSCCEFQFSANAGQPVQPLAKIASSGELARVMLAIKTILAQADKTPVLVFDEVDANVGGEIGSEVGAELASLAKNRQVFCVTHLPQVAGQAKNHFLVEKIQDEESTNVSISQIDTDKQKRVHELARMIGDRNSQSAIEHAKKLLTKNGQN